MYVCIPYIIINKIMVRFYVKKKEIKKTRSSDNLFYFLLNLIVSLLNRTTKLKSIPSLQHFVIIYFLKW